MKRVLLLLPSASYRNEDFIAAGRGLGIEMLTAADYCHQLAPGWGMNPLLSLPFDQPETAVETLLALLPERPDAVLAVDDAGVELAAMARERLGLPGNPVSAVRVTRDKLAFRKLLQEARLNCPDFRQVAQNADFAALAETLQFPVVVKARRLSSSRGVIRANDAGEFVQAARRVQTIQANADRDAADLGLVVESFIPGCEFALEGMLENGKLRVLALFDKPDPLDGPYFEETIYVTPSRIQSELQRRISEAVERGCRAAGLVEGPIHAEMRLNDEGVWLLEIAARSIGGLCARVLRHALGMSLEELILRQALRLPVPDGHSVGAVGVMMIPAPWRGIYEGVHNLDAAMNTPGIDGIQITAMPGQIV
jgi:formate-dependent phosphoribosylglycinamide formyltransferase (GAR transformylase)